MGTPLNLWYEEPWGMFLLMRTDRPRRPTCAWGDEIYEYRFHLVRTSLTGEIVGFSNEGNDLAQDYPRLMELLAVHPVPGRYDVPDLGLTGATLPEIITAIYERYVVGQQPAFIYPVVERVPVLRVAEDEPEEYASEVDH